MGKKPTKAASSTAAGTDDALEKKEGAAGGKTYDSPAACDARSRGTGPAGPGPAMGDLPAIDGAPPLAPHASDSDVSVVVTLIHDDYSHVEAPVVIGARYEGLAFAGAAKIFDGLLGSWLTRALDMGMTGSALGQLFPVDLQCLCDTGKVKARHLLLAGLGEPGRFAADDLQFLASNITFAVKSMGYDQFATALPGVRRNELPVGDAVRSFICGIEEGYKRFKDFANGVREGRECLRQRAQNPVHVLLVDTDLDRLTEIREKLETLRNNPLMTGVNIEVVGHPIKDFNPSADGDEFDDKPAVRATFLRVTRKEPPLSAATAAPPTTTSQLGLTDTFEFSALSDQSTVAVREEDVNSYLMQKLSERMIAPQSGEKGHREKLGRFFTNLVIPEDLKKVAENANLTLEVDATTAMYPWEMMARNNHGSTLFLGLNAGVSRMFRSLLAPRPSAPPALNRSLRALVIADPTSDQWPLPLARDEGFSVVENLNAARQRWHEQYDIKADVRIGARANPDPRLAQWRLQKDWISAETCDPLEIAMLIVNEPYDVIHYAGHGFVDAKNRRAGWVLGKDCSLSAQEIFRVRQVPRLVFANACLSAVIPGNTDGEQRKWLVGIAMALLARGIPNFIGAGWKVDDAAAGECARRFYELAFGVQVASSPATISESLRNARQKTFEFRPESSTWGAYQHYGSLSDRLLPLPDAAPRVSDEAQRQLARSGTPNPASGDQPQPQA